MKASFLVIDKPPGITSHDVVAIVRAVTGIEKVGHTGTLDPFATGVLPLALGGATKLIQFLDESMKVYDATIRFGFETDTGDPSGQATREAPLPTADRAQAEAIVRTFLGERMQVPPKYSAVKKDGKPLYYYARKGKPVEVPARPITIHDLKVMEYDGQTMRVIITCSRGTYARVLAEELAVALDSAGHLSALSRSRSGPFYLDDALSMTDLARLVSAEPDRGWQEVLLSRGRQGPRVAWNPRDDVRDALVPWLRRPLDALSHLPLAEVDEAGAKRVLSGGAPPSAPGSCAVGDRYLVVSGDRLLAIAENASRGPSTLRAL